jgi:hypothetical protein|tara:strand:+ start:622 stop:789 length:168 start_codon:yes stop_codon:yes gene_type:complete
MNNERRDEDWINPPEPKEKYEPDWDSINDDKWLREDEEEIDIEVELDIKKELFDE